jgi:hypothetical protein
VVGPLKPLNGESVLTALLRDGGVIVLEEETASLAKSDTVHRKARRPMDRLAGFAGVTTGISLLPLFDISREIMTWELRTSCLHPSFRIRDVDHISTKKTEKGVHRILQAFDNVLEYLRFPSRNHCDDA